MPEVLDTDTERFSRLTAISRIGVAGLERLTQACVVIIGCGGLGSTSAELLVRSGIGRLRLVDDDCVEPGNLYGQGLYAAQDARQSRAKVCAAQERLLQIQPDAWVEPVQERFERRNAARLLDGTDLVLDGTDNDYSRYWINQACLQEGIPWIFAATRDCAGLTMNVIPGETPCFVCAFGIPTRPGPRYPNQCSLSSVTQALAAIQVCQAIRLLTCQEYNRGLVYVDAWEPCLETLEIHSPINGCPACGRR